jgi:hypothetical protein
VKRVLALLQLLMGFVFRGVFVVRGRGGEGRGDEKRRDIICFGFLGL